MTVGAAPTVIVLVAVAATQEPGAFVVSVKVTVPLKFGSGVYVTASGFPVCAVLLKIPPPEVMLQAPVVALPPTLAPVKVIADGVAD